MRFGEYVRNIFSRYGFLLFAKNFLNASDYLVLPSGRLVNKVGFGGCDDLHELVLVSYFSHSALHLAKGFVADLQLVRPVVCKTMTPNEFAFTASTNCTCDKAVIVTASNQQCDN